MLRTLLRLLVITPLAVLFSGLAEKQRHKALAVHAPVVLSASRIVAVSLAATWCAVALRRGVGWPMAALGALLAFALPITAALRRSAPEDVLAFGGRIIEPFGTGDPADPGGPSPGYARPASVPTDAVRRAGEGDEP